MFKKLTPLTKKVILYWGKRKICSQMNFSKSDITASIAQTLAEGR